MIAPLHTWTHSNSDCIHDLVSQNPSMDREGSHEIPPLAKELMAIDGFLRKESQFSPGMAAPQSLLPWEAIHSPVAVSFTYIQAALRVLIKFF